MQTAAGMPVPAACRKQLNVALLKGHVTLRDLQVAIANAAGLGVTSHGRVPCS